MVNNQCCPPTQPRALNRIGSRKEAYATSCSGSFPWSTKY
jgi:hypothetical protein